MDGKQARAVILDVYSRTTSKTLDNKTLNYLVLSVTKGENTIKNIIESLLVTKEYEDRIRRTYEILYFDILGETPSHDNVDEFWSKLDKSRIIDGTEIENLILEQNLRNIINSYHKSKYPAGKTYSDAIYQELLKLVKEDRTLGYVQVCDRFNELMLVEISEKENKKESERAVETYFSTPFADESLHEELLSLPQHSPIGDLYGSHNIKLDDYHLSLFEKAFNRHMYVQEYFKYIVYQDRATRAVTFADLTKLKEDYTKSFNTIANIYSSFCNTELTEHVFASKHLMDIDSENYHDKVIDDIINTPDHEAFMMQTLQSYYKKLYEISMDDSDLRYLVKKVKTMKIHPRDERLVDILKEFKAQTDEFVENIFNVYKLTLERQPDMYELEEQLASYRIASREFDTDHINKQLSCNLAATLEFHDIIKKHIKTIYTETTQKEISPSRLFQVLHGVLGMTESPTTIENLDDRIRGFLGV